MNDIKIVVPSRGRASSQYTIAALPTSLYAQTCIVVPKEEYKAYRAECDDRVEIIAQPKRIDSIAAKRGWICKELCTSKLLMLDDDLTFQVRYDPAFRPVKDFAEGVRLLEPRRVEHVEQGFRDLSKLMDKWVHGGLGSRLFNNRQVKGVQFNGRCMHALAFTKEACDIIKWGRVNLKEDFDATLQMLRRGYPNFIMHYLAVSPKPYGAEGGCTTERGSSGHSASAHQLAAAHPEYVRVVTKNYKGVPRDEVVVSWQKALRDGGGA